MSNFEISGGAKKAVKKLTKATSKKVLSSKKKLMTTKSSYKPKKNVYKTKTKSSVNKAPERKYSVLKPVTNKFTSSIYDSASKDVQDRTAMFFRLFMSSIYFAASTFIYYQIFYKYLVHLDEINCKCATNNWKYIVLRIYFIYVLSILIADFITLVININKPRTFSSYILDDVSQNKFAKFNVLLHIVMVIIANMYIQDLYSSNCECSEDERRDIFTIISVVELLIYALLGIRIFVFLFAYIMGKISTSIY
jgi:hypothetical protein